MDNFSALEQGFNPREERHFIMTEAKVRFRANGDLLTLLVQDLSTTGAFIICRNTRLPSVGDELYIRPVTTTNGSWAAGVVVRTVPGIGFGIWFT